MKQENNRQKYNAETAIKFAEWIMPLKPSELRNYGSVGGGECYEYKGKYYTITELFKIFLKEK